MSRRNRKYRTFHFELWAEDFERCKEAAKLNRFKRTSTWMRAIINGHFKMMGWPLMRIISSKRTYCKNGHKYTKENIIKRKGYKVCRICFNTSARKYYAKKKMSKMRRLGKHSVNNIAS